MLLGASEIGRAAAFGCTSSNKSARDSERFNAAVSSLAERAGRGHRAPPALPRSHEPGERHTRRPVSHRKPTARLDQAALDPPATAASPDAESRAPECAPATASPDAASRAAPEAAPAREPDATVTILVECAPCPDADALSISHDVSKYDEYYARVSEALTGVVHSPCGHHTIACSVQRTACPIAVAADWETTSYEWCGGGAGGSSRAAGIAANVHAGGDTRTPRLSLGGGAGVSYQPGGSRLGAFEVYLVTSLPSVPSVPPCAGLHSKLASRKWPNVHSLAERLRRLLAPAFVRWQADADVHAALPVALAEAADARALLEACRDVADPSLVAQLEATVTDRERADTASERTTGSQRQLVDAVGQRERTDPYR